MRRSSSVTRIPLPRSKSSIRPSIRESACTLKVPTNRASLKRSISATNLRRTDLTTPTLNKISSTRLTPSSSVLRSRSPFSNYRKNVNDKKWVAEQCRKVQEYFEMLNEQITIKPMSTQVFVFIIENLFNQIDVRIRVTMENYKEVVFAELKRFNYPGQVSPSLLKTVNIPHNFCHIISILSWLIDLVRILQRAQFPEACCHDVNSYQTEKIYLDVTLDYYNAYNNIQQFESAEIEQKCNEIIDEFTDLLKRMLNIDDIANTNLQNNLERLKNEKEEKVNNLNKLVQDLQAIENEISEKTKEIESFENNYETKEKSVEDEMKKLEEKKNDLNRNIVKIRKGNASLKTTIAKQTHSYEQKKELLTKIEEIKNTCDLKSEMWQKWQQVKDDYDTRFTEIKRKVGIEVTRINASVIELSVIYPKLKELNIRTERFFDADFQKEIEKKMQLWQNMNEEMKSESASIKSQIETIETECADNEKCISTISKQMIKISDRINRYQCDIEKIEENIQNLFAQTQNAESKNQLKILNANYKNEINKLEDYKNELIKEIQAKNIEIENFKMEALQFFVDVKDNVFLTVQKLEEVRSEVYQIMDGLLKCHLKTYKHLPEDIYKLNGIILDK